MTLEYKQLSDFRAASTITNGDLVYMQALTDGIEQKATVRQLVNYIIGVLGSQRQSIPVTADGQSIFTTEGYTAPLVNVYYKGLRLRPSQYRAMDGITIVITDPTVLAELVIGDTIDVDLLQSMAVSGAATPQSVAALDPGNLLPIPSVKGSEQVAARQGAAMYQITLDQLTQRALSTLAAQAKSIPITQDGQTVFNVTYTPPVVSLFLMGWFISPSLYTATDGQTITITDPDLASKFKAGMTIDLAGSQTLSGGNAIDPEVIDQLFPANQTPAAGLGLTDLVTVSQGGNLRSSTLSQLANFALGTLAPQRASITVQNDGQSVFTTPGYTVPLINLYLLGRRISPNNYHATDGVTFTITNAALISNIKAGMIIEMDAQQSIAVAGVPTAAQVAALDPGNQTSVTTILGTELVSMKQGVNFVAGTLTKIAQWMLGVYAGFTQNGTGAIGRTLLSKLGDTVNVRDFGAIGNGIADDTLAIQKALNSLTTGGRVVISAGMQCYVASNLTIPSGVTLEGPYLTPDSMASLSSSGIMITALTGSILLNTNATISLSGGSALRGLPILANGVTIPATSSAAFAGTAITVAGPGAYVGYCLVVGFNRLIYSSGYERPKLEWVYGDGNTGIEITACNDIARIAHCHFWPYVTYTPTAPASNHQRSGAGFYLHDTVDEPVLEDCFAYGYNNGYYFKNVSTVTATNCKADGTGTNWGDSGWRFEGNINGFAGSANASWSHTNGVVVNTNTTQFVDISGFISNSNVTAITLLAGHVRVRSSQFFSGTTLCSITSNASIFDIDDTLIANVTNMVSSTIATTNVLVGSNNVNLTSAAGSSMTSANITVPTIASADPIQLPMYGSVFNISGTTNFGTLQGGWAGRRVYLVFLASLTVYNGTANATNIAVKGGGNFAATANSVMELVHNGSLWIQV